MDSGQPDTLFRRRRFGGSDGATVTGDLMLNAPLSARSRERALRIHEEDRDDRDQKRAHERMQAKASALLFFSPLSRRDVMCFPVFGHGYAP